MGSRASWGRGFKFQLSPVILPVSLWQQVALVVKNPPANVGDLRCSVIPGLGRSPGGERGNPPQCSCVENPMDRGVWWATDHRVTKSGTRLKWPSMPTRPGRCFLNHWNSLITKMIVLSPLKNHQGRKSTQIKMALRIFHIQSHRDLGWHPEEVTNHLPLRPFWTCLSLQCTWQDIPGNAQV